MVRGRSLPTRFIEDIHLEGTGFLYLKRKFLINLRHRGRIVPRGNALYIFLRVERG